MEVHGQVYGPNYVATETTFCLLSLSKSCPRVHLDSRIDRSMICSVLGCNTYRGRQGICTIHESRARCTCWVCITSIYHTSKSASLFMSGVLQKHILYTIHRTLACFSCWVCSRDSNTLYTETWLAVHVGCIRKETYRGPLRLPGRTPETEYNTPDNNTPYERIHRSIGDH